MRYLKIFGLAAVFGMFLMAAPGAHAQRLSVGVAVGPAYVAGPPACTYGYYGYYPYACAPYGYYGPQYFSGGVFLGAGPWFHGFYGDRFYRGGPVFRGPAVVGRGPVGPVGGFHGAPAFHGPSGGFHGGGHR